MVSRGRGKRYEGDKERQPVEKVILLLNLRFLFCKPFLWSGKAKYSAEELKELPLSDVLLMSDRGKEQTEK